MDLTITVDYHKALQQLTDDGERQVPYALARAVNSTALDVQRAVRNRMHSIFTLRRPEWADRSVKIAQFAKKSDPTAIVGIHPPGAGGEQRADIFAKFESDTLKLPKQGTIAIPVSRVGLRRHAGGAIRNEYRPRNLVAWGKGVFIIRKKMGAVGEGLILQRLKLGKGRSSTVALYYLVSRARINPNLKFIQSAVSVIDTRFSEHMVREFDNAMKTAR